MENDLVQGTEDNWLGALPDRERKRLEEMLRTLSPEKVAEQLMVEAGTQQYALTKKKGPSAKQGGRHIFTRLKRQFDMFVCGHPSYEQARKEFLATAKKSHTQAVAMLATLLGSTIHLAAAVLAPPIVALLIAFLKIGQRAYCERFMISAEKDEKKPKK